MSDPRSSLQAMFEESKRYNNFGDVLMRILIRGFRCHTNTLIEVASPITALCGLNGTGKSTILQLAATAYSRAAPDSWAYYIKNFLVVGTLDPNPFTVDATVEFKFWQNDRTTKPLTISRSDTTKRWQGYPRRPSRKVLFAGNGVYLPKIEQNDFPTRFASKLTVFSNLPVLDQIKSSTSKVLGQSYNSIVTNTVRYSDRQGTVISVERGGTTYSEAHMGFGEGRTQHLITAMESLPEKSLVLIEEPETSLHPSAQYELAQYFVDVARRKKHQMFLTTHSEFILEALPSQSRVYLHREASRIVPIPGITSAQARSLMSQGHVKALVVLVEDDSARYVLNEIVRRIDQQFLQCIGIHTVGDANTVTKTVRSLRDTGLRVAGVLDGDQNGDPRHNLFKLPGALPPEKEMWGSSAVKDQLQQTYNVNIVDFAAGLTDVDHHHWFTRLADHVNQDKSAIIAEAARTYANSLLESDASTLTNLLKEAART